MKRKRITSFVVLMLSCVLFSCEREEYVEITYDRICRVSDLYLDGTTIRPVFDYDAGADAESRLFYAEADTSLFFKIRKLPAAKTAYMSLSSFDVRITDITVKTLQYYDENHPAGSSLDDVLNVSYCYKKQTVSIPVTEVKNHPIMLVDFYTYADSPEYCFTLDFPKDAYLCEAMEVTIEDAFGRKMTIRTDDDNKILK